MLKIWSKRAKLQMNPVGLSPFSLVKMIARVRMLMKKPHNNNNKIDLKTAP